MKEQKIQDPGNLPHQKILHPLKSAAFAVTGSSVQRYYLIVLEREHYCCWSIEFLNFLHKSSSSRSNLLLPFVHQNFPTPIYLTPFCPTIELLRIRIIGLNSFILETDYSPSSFLERSWFELLFHRPLPWRQTCFGHEWAAWGTSRRNTLSLRMLGLSAASYAEGDCV